LRLQPHLSGCDLTFGLDIHEPGETVNYVYFPLRGLISIVAAMEDGTAVEIHMVGREGMFSLSTILDDDRPFQRAMVQLPGRALRMSPRLFQREMTDNLGMRRLLHRYAQAVITSVAQSAACNRLHLLELRCARWLLLAHDRADGDTFPVTHDFISMMLGVRRPGVTIAAQALQADGLISYNHGTLTVVDREGLEARACECYRAIKGEFARLMSAPAG
jgi:CRP-like cAMP-binding protein